MSQVVQVYRLLLAEANKYFKILSKLLDGDSELAMLLQHLWNQFFNEGPLVYTDISSLAFDVAEEDIAMLDDNFIIERNAENKNEIRMVDFTH